MSRHSANDGTQKKKDVYDKRNFLEGRVAMLDIDAPDDARASDGRVHVEGEGSGGWDAVAVGVWPVSKARR